MTINFKPGQHPDADQLSAFIEQALPAHERESVLAHLAVCGECRGVVALALPEVPAFESAAPAPAARRWFAGWMVLLPASAAVAVLAVFIVFVHHQAPAPQQQAQITPAPQVQTAPQPQPQAVPQASAAPITSAVISERPPAPKPRQETPHAVMGDVAGAPQGVAQALQLDQNQTQSPAANAFNSAAPSERLRSADRPGPVQQNSTQQNVLHGELQAGKPNQVATQSDDKLQSPRARQEPGQQQNGYQNAANETVSVQAESAPLETQSSELKGLIVANAGGGLVVTRQPLPSGRAIVSTAAQGTMVLAIDTHHGVYVSNDSGGHWQPVRAVWKGRAVRVEAIATTPSLAAPAAGRSVASLDALSAGAMAAKTAGATLTGTVTDRTGAVIPGATITVTDPATNLSRTFTTDASGSFTAAGLEPGNYNLEASSRGFETNHLANVAVSATNKNVANVSLEVGAATQTVTVESSSQMVDLNAAPVTNKKKAAKATGPVSVSAAPAPGPSTSGPVFEIVTDKGVRWTSADGVAWRPE
jgi:Carboxypeptidase regulatory-like domain/Putative zinc-finger